jgi:serine/threonine-protein kinase BUR1
MITYREVGILKIMHHPNIVPLLDLVFERGNFYKPTCSNLLDETGKPKLYFVFPFMHHDLAGLIDNRDVPFTQPIVKCYLKQILEGTRFLHFNNIIHRDMKPANLLINHEGQLMITDFGLARPLDLARQGKYTPNVVTRWYRAPELCMGSVDYNTKIDIWSVGCIFGEMLLRHPILQGSSDADQIFRIFHLCGTPLSSEWPCWRRYPLLLSLELSSQTPCLRQVFNGFGEDCLNLLESFLRLNPHLRISADLALNSEYLWQDPLPATRSELPEFPSSHEYNSLTARERRKQAP